MVEFPEGVADEWDAARAAMNGHYPTLTPEAIAKINEVAKRQHENGMLSDEALEQFMEALEAEAVSGNSSGGLSAFERAAQQAADSVTNPPPVLTPDYFAPLGVPLCYGGVLNSIIGPGGLMKTTLGLLAAGAHTGHTLFISLEKSRPSLLNTARWVGADTSRMLVATSVDDAEEIIASAPTGSDLLVVVDSTLSLMSRFGWNEDSSTDVGALEAKLMSWYATDRVGCIVLIDHTGHQPGRARGSSRKGQMIQGRMWVLHHDRGTVKVVCEKDNSGEAEMPWSYDLTKTGPVLSSPAIVKTPIEQVAIAACGIAPNTGLNKAWQQIKAHPDYPKWQESGLRRNKVREVLSGPHQGFSAAAFNDEPEPQTTFDEPEDVYGATTNDGS